MSDQCKHCTVRGDIQACKKTECNQHESWYVRDLKAERDRLRNQGQYQIGDLVEDEVGHSGVVVIRWDDGDRCWLENDAAHPNPKIVGHADWPKQ